VNVQARLTQGGQLLETVWDTGCGMSLIERACLLAHLPQIAHRQMDEPLSVEGIGGGLVTTTSYVVLSIRVPGVDSLTNLPVEAVFTRDFHIIDDPTVSTVFVGTDAMVLERCLLDLPGKELKIGSCGVVVPIRVHDVDDA
jgi:hypothetical protein